MSKSTSSLKLVAVLALAAVLPFHSFAGDGANSGGGAPKPPAAFGYENFGVILKDSQVSAILGLSLEITEIKRVKVEPPLRTYQISAESVMGTNQCVFNVTVFNDHPTTIDLVRVTEVKIVSGCQNTPEPKETSIWEIAPDYFKVFEGTGFQPEKPYAEYLSLAQKITPARRAEVIALMLSTGQKRYAQVYRAKAQQMVDFMKKNPNATVGEFYVFLGEEIMGLSVPQNGIVGSVLVGLEFAPLFIADAALPNGYVVISNR